MSYSYTPYTLHGPLYVSGAKLMDGNRIPFQLHGVSTHGLAWYPQYVTKETFQYLRDAWHVNCIRLALYTAGSMGYQTDGDKESLLHLLTKGIDIASSLGLYVIVDWHVLEEHDPMVYLEGAKAFFQEVSSRYGTYGNILYEICNEPNGNCNWDRVHTYASQIIPIIQKNAPYSVILVGTPNWCQDINVPQTSPILARNIMYTMHFYAATHGQEMRSRLLNAISNGIPVFISEFGICDASGNGSIDVVEGNTWRSLIEQHGLSFICWNLSNKKESSSLINAMCPKLDDFTDNDLSPHGRWFRDWCQTKSL